MAHKFDRTDKDPYVEAAHELENNLFTESQEYEAGAGEQLYDELSNAIVTALGDIAAQAFRNGVDDPRQLEGLARAVAGVSKTVLTTYVGETDSDPALGSIPDDPRFASLSPENQTKLCREIENTRELEKLLLHAKRVPDLIDLAGSLGLHLSEDALEEGTLLVQRHPAPTPPGA